MFVTTVARLGLTTVTQHGSKTRDIQHDGVVSYQRARHTINATITEQRLGAQ